jgi:hypothetical protein
MSSLKEQILAAARAESIPSGESGLWVIKKETVPEPLPHFHPRLKKRLVLPAGTYTRLLRSTESTMHIGGEVVMEDTIFELQTHLRFMLRARGRVLITGLGLGCVVRGCLANPAVKHVVCVEKDMHVLRLVAQHMPKDRRLTIVVADALKWCKHPELKFDCAWHDLWTDSDNGEEHLQVVHAHLLLAMSRKVDFQGAWDFPRDQKRLWGKLIEIV